MHSKPIYSKYATHVRLTNKLQNDIKIKADTHKLENLLHRLDFINSDKDCFTNEDKACVKDLLDKKQPSKSRYDGGVLQSDDLELLYRLLITKSKETPPEWTHFTRICLQSSNTDSMLAKRNEMLDDIIQKLNNLLQNHDEQEPVTKTADNTATKRGQIKKRENLSRRPHWGLSTKIKYSLF